MNVSLKRPLLKVYPITTGRGITYTATSEEFSGTYCSAMMILKLIGNSLRERLLLLQKNIFQELLKGLHLIKPPWWSSSLAKVIKQKQQLYSTFKFTHLPSDYKAYTIKQNKVNSMIRAAQAKHDQNLIDEFHDNPKALYGYMRDKCGTKPKIGQVIKTDGTLTVNDGETTEVLNNFFNQCLQMIWCC